MSPAGSPGYPTLIGVFYYSRYGYFRYHQMMEQEPLKYFKEQLYEKSIVHYVQLRLGVLMDKSFFRSLFGPQLETPVFIEGLPGFGNVGKITARMLIKSTHAKPFAELYSPFFPDYVIVNKSGICRIPRYEFYASSKEKPHFIILTGDAQPSLEDITAHYQLCDEILDFAEKYGSNFLVTIGGVPTPNPSREIYVSATSNNLALQYMEKGAIIYGKGRIMGATGLLLGLAKNRGWDGICLLGATTGIKADREAALSVFNFLIKSFGVKLKKETLTKETGGKR